MKLCNTNNTRLSTQQPVDVRVYCIPCSVPVDRTHAAGGLTPPPCTWLQVAHISSVAYLARLGGPCRSMVVYHHGRQYLITKNKIIIS